MRKINFRAWHREKQMMCDVIAVGVMDGWVDIMPAPDSSWTTDLDDVELMQFTGLLDKNGVEIYEGDVLATSNDGQDGADVWGQEVLGAVYWNDKFACWNHHIALNDDESIYSLQYVKVIGNIYQNPDLLELSNIEKT